MVESPVHLPVTLSSLLFHLLKEDYSSGSPVLCPVLLEEDRGAKLPEFQITSLHGFGAYKIDNYLSAPT